MQKKYELFRRVLNIFVLVLVLVLVLLLVLVLSEAILVLESDVSASQRFSEPLATIHSTHAS
jgi:hypothetical protein